MPRYTVPRSTARKIFLGTMAGAILLTVTVAGISLLRETGTDARKAVARQPHFIKTQPASAPLPVPAKTAPAISAAAQQPVPQPEFTLKRVLEIKGPLDHGDYVWDDKGVPPGPMVVTIDLEAQTLSVFRGGYEIGVAVILYGATDKPTPLGTYPILEKDIDHVSNLYDAPMPYGLRLTHDGVFIHASSVKWGSATHGCIGVPMAFAKRLFAAVKLGDPIVITSGKRMMQSR